MEKSGLIVHGKGFNDLPGGKNIIHHTFFILTVSELHNQCYNCILSSSPSLKEAVSISSACHTIRAEFMPTYFEGVGVDVKFCLVKDFLEVFFAESNVSGLAACKLRIDIGRCTDHHRKFTIDVKCILGTLTRYPDIIVSFSGRGDRKGEARDLEKLVNIARVTPMWREHLQNFHAMQLKGWSYTHCFSYHPCWIMELVLRADNTQGWCTSHVHKMKEELGLRLASMPGRVTPFESLAVQVYRQPKATEGKSE